MHHVNYSFQSAKLEFEFLLVMKAVLVDLSMGLCCVIRVIVCKCCGLSVAMPMANSPTPSLQQIFSITRTDSTNRT